VQCQIENSEKYMIATTVCTQLQKKSNETKRTGKDGCLT
jgi:hypothetical protein